MRKFHSFYNTKAPILGVGGRKIKRQDDFNTLLFYEAKKIENFAFCIMPNHVHWVFRTFEAGENGTSVYMQDILQSVKRYSSNFINKAIGRTGTLWQKESFDTTIRDEKHLWTAMEYTLNNPVKAGLVSSPEEWTGSWVKK